MGYTLWGILAIVVVMWIVMTFQFIGGFWEGFKEGLAESLEEDNPAVVKRPQTTSTYSVRNINGSRVLVERKNGHNYAPAKVLHPEICQRRKTTWEDRIL